MTTGTGTEHVAIDRSDDRRRVIQNDNPTFQVADRELLERAILNEALIVEQLRIGRRWQVKDKRNRTADVSFA